MLLTNASATRRSVRTLSGEISYIEQGAGPVALFVHGVLLNSHLWRHQLSELSDIRCIAVDLLAHGDTDITPEQDVSVTAYAEMLKQFLDALHIDQVDLIGSARLYHFIPTARYIIRLVFNNRADCGRHREQSSAQVLGEVTTRYACC